MPPRTSERSKRPAETAVSRRSVHAGMHAALAVPNITHHNVAVVQDEFLVLVDHCDHAQPRALLLEPHHVLRSYGPAEPLVAPRAECICALRGRRGEEEGVGELHGTGGACRQRGCHP